MPPEIELANLGIGQVGRFLGVELDDAGADVRAADIDAQNAVVTGGDPGRRQMEAADKAGIVRMMADRLQLEIVALAFQDDSGAADRDLADARSPQAAADHDALGLVPSLQPEETTDDRRELLGKLLDRRLNQPDRLQIAVGQQLVELFLAQILA